MLDSELNLACTSNRVYAVVSFGTVFVGVIALMSGVGMEFVTPIVLTGSLASSTYTGSSVVRGRTNRSELVCRELYPRRVQSD